MAEGYYNFFTKSNKAISAGVNGDKAREKYNNHPSSEVIALMKEDGVDISQQKIDQLTPNLIESVERVVVLCDKKEISGQILKNAKEVLYIHILDPYAQSIEKMRKIRDEIKHLVMKLIENEI